jgi:cysteine desulfurase / selenocysteine lyase
LSPSISDEFPQIEGRSYLNTATIGLIPKSVVESVKSLYDHHLQGSAYPDLWEELARMVEDSRGVLAGFIGSTKEELSFQPSASASMNFVVSMISPTKGDNVVVDDLGFPSGTYPAMRLQQKGVETRWVRNKEGLITAQDYERVIDRNTRLVIVSLVSWVNGLRAEVEKIIKLAHENGALCMVDSTHGTGYIDIDVRRWDVDFLASSNYKWLLSTHGSAEFFCAGRLLEEFEPPQLGWHSTPAGEVGLGAEKLEIAKTSRRFEPGNPDYISVGTVAKSVGVLSAFGKSQVYEKTLELSRMVNEGLRELGLDVLSPGDKEHLSAITFASTKKVPGTELALKLRENNIIVVARPYHERSGIRVSPYFYNDAQDVEKFLECVNGVVRSS